MKKAFSLVEMLVVVGIIAVLVGLTIPAINALQKSYDSTGADSMISAALATARTLAISNHQYAGVRFQKAGDPNNSLNADQYMIFVINDTGMPQSNLDEGFRVIEGYKPVKLPENIGVIDKMVRRNISNSEYDTRTDNANEWPLSSSVLDNSNLNRAMMDTSAFSLIFSPAGKLVIHDIRIRNKKGDYRSSTLKDSGYDDVFNSFKNIDVNDVGMFEQDDYAQSGLGGEKSRRQFYIYDREKFKTMTTASQRWTYLNGLAPIFVNPYTGQIIEK